MAVVGELLVLIGANTSALTAGLAKSEAELKGFGSSGTNALAGIRLGALAVGAATVAGMGLAVNAASTFQEQMAIINTIAHQTPTELDKTGDSIRAMAVATGTPLSDMTKAFYDLLSAGVPVSQAMAVLKDSTTLAIGGLATTAQTVDLLTSAINSYHLNARGAATATDQFALAVQDGKVTADQIASTFADVAPLAAQMHVGIDEIATSYAVLTARGVPAGEVTTQMNRAMLEMLKPNADLNALQAKTHENFAKIAGEKGVVVALQEMRDAAAANNVPFQDLFGRIDGFKFALATTGPNFQTYTDELTKMHNANGTASAQAEERMGTFSRQTAILGASLNDLAINVGTGLLPPLTSFVQSVSAAVQSASAWAEANPQVASTILPIVAGIAALVVAATSLSAIFGVIGTAIGIITSPIILAVAALAALAAHFGLLGAGAQSAVDGFGATILSLIPQVLATLGELGSQVLAWIAAQAPAWAAQALAWGEAFVGWISPMIGQAIAMLGALAGQIAAWIVAQIPGWIAQLGQWASAFVNWIAPMIPVALATLGAFAGRVVDWIASQLPVWGAALLRWVQAFVEWVGPMVPKVIAALGTLGVAIFNWIAARVPVVAGALLGLAATFVAWVAPKIPGLLVELGKLALAMIGWIAQQIPVIARAVLAWIGSFIGWVAQSTPGIAAALGQWLASVLAWMATVPGQLWDAAVGWGKSIAQGIISGIGDIPAAIAAAIGGGSGSGASAAAAAAYHTGGHVPSHESGGIVAGSGPQLIMAHGGELVTPANQVGGGAQPVIHQHRTIVVQIDGHTLAEVLDEEILRRANAFSSGLTALPGLTGA